MGAWEGHLHSLPQPSCPEARASYWGEVDEEGRSISLQVSASGGGGRRGGGGRMLPVGGECMGAGGVRWMDFWVVMGGLVELGWGCWW